MLAEAWKSRLLLEKKAGSHSVCLTDQGSGEAIRGTGMRTEFVSLKEVNVVTGEEVKTVAFTDMAFTQSEMEGTSTQVVTCTMESGVKVMVIFTAVENSAKMRFGPCSFQVPACSQKWSMIIQNWQFQSSKNHRLILDLKVAPDADVDAESFYLKEKKRVDKSRMVLVYKNSEYSTETDFGLLEVARNDNTYSPVYLGVKDKHISISLPSFKQSLVYDPDMSVRYIIDSNDEKRLLDDMDLTPDQFVDDKTPIEVEEEEWDELMNDRAPDVVDNREEAKEEEEKEEEEEEEEEDEDEMAEERADLEPAFDAPKPGDVEGPEEPGDGDLEEEVEPSSSEEGEEEEEEKEEEAEEEEGVEEGEEEPKEGERKLPRIETPALQYAFLGDFPDHVFVPKDLVEDRWMKEHAVFVRYHAVEEVTADGKLVRRIPFRGLQYEAKYTNDTANNRRVYTFDSKPHPDPAMEIGLKFEFQLFTTPRSLEFGHVKWDVNTGADKWTLTVNNYKFDNPENKMLIKFDVTHVQRLPVEVESVNEDMDGRVVYTWSAGAMLVDHGLLRVCKQDGDFKPNLAEMTGGDVTLTFDSFEEELVYDPEVEIRLLADRPIEKDLQNLLSGM